MTPSVRRSAGFSLLEVLLAVALFALAMGLAYGGLDAVLRARDQLAAGATALEALQRAIGTLERDLRAAQPRPVREGDRNRLAALVIDSDGLELSRGGFANRLAQPRAEIERVRWRRQDTRLLRRAFPMLDRAAGAEFTDSELLDGVDRLSIEALGDDGRWQSRWPLPGAAAETLPKAVRIRLQVQGFGEIERWFELAAPGAER